MCDIVLIVNGLDQCFVELFDVLFVVVLFHFVLSGVSLLMSFLPVLSLGIVVVDVRGLLVVCFW